MHQETGAISEPNLIFKYALLGLLLVQLVVSLTNNFWEDYAVLSLDSRAQFL